MRSQRRRAPRKGDLHHVLAVRPGPFAEWSKAFIDACGHVVNGEIGYARELLKSVDGRAISIWYDYTAQNAGRDRAVLLGVRGRSEGGSSPLRARDEQRMPDKAVTSSLRARDRNRCRYCRQAVIDSEILRLVSSKTGINLTKADSNLETHGLYWLHCASIDHVDPHARRGSTSPENLVVSCNACQFGKGPYTLEELDLELRPPAPELRTSFGTWSNIVNSLAVGEFDLTL